MFVSPSIAAGRSDFALPLLPSSPLIALAAQGSRTAQNYQATKVNAAYAKVKAIFDQPVVWKNDLVAISATFERLGPPERQSLVNLMARPSDRGHLPLLTRWLARATHNSVAAFDGLDAKGRVQLWKQLVVGQDKANLVRIFQAIGQPNNPSLKDGEHHQMQFAQAIATSGSAQQRTDFIDALLPAALKGKTDAATNRSARAIAVLMAEMKDPQQISQWVKTLYREGMDAVVAASLPTRGAGSVAGFEAADTKLFQRLATAMSLSTKASEKAIFVAAAGPVLEGLNNTAIGPNQNRKQLGEVSRAISTVIGTNTTGVIENVMLQNSDSSRSNGPAALKAFARAALDSGCGKDLGAITLLLQRGNDLKTDPMDYLAQRANRTGAPGTYANAWVMGGWLGLVGAAVRSRINRRDTNAANSGLMFAGLMDTAKELISVRFPVFKLVSPAVKTAVIFSVLNWRQQATGADLEFAQNLMRGALPRHSIGVEARADWTAIMKLERSDRLNNN